MPRRIRRRAADPDASCSLCCRYVARCVRKKNKTVGYTSYPIHSTVTLFTMFSSPVSSIGLISSVLRSTVVSLMHYSLARTLAAWWTTLLQAAWSLVSCSASSVDRCVHSLMSSLQALRGLPPHAYFLSSLWWCTSSSFVFFSQDMTEIS